MPSTSVSQSILFRSCREDDCAHLALLADMATRRLTSFLWGQMASSGQSAFEVGRNIIRNDESQFIHFRNWRVAEHEGRIVGALNGYIIPAPTGPAAPPPEVVRTLNELKTMAAGTWYMSAAAIYVEQRGKGFGKLLLAEAEACARAMQKDRLTLMVGSFNPKAYNLYRQTGFEEWDRRPFSPFPGSDEPGEWILMVKNLP